MPAPSAPTSMTFTQDATYSAPQGRLQWSQTATNLDRFQVMYRPTGTTAWENYGVYVAADLLVSGTTYRLDVVAPIGYEWLVRSMSAAGEVST